MSKYRSRKLWLTITILALGIALVAIFLIVEEYEKALAVFLAVTGSVGVYNGVQAWQNRADGTRGYLPGDGPGGGA